MRAASERLQWIGTSQRGADYPSAPRRSRSPPHQRDQILGRGQCRSTWQARWTEGELWHPQQKMRKLDDGRVEIEVPYSSDGELLMDVLAHVPHVEVVAPPELRAEFRRRLELGLAPHENPAPASD